MRVLKPETAKRREESILRWVIQEFVESKRPVGSELVAQKGGLGVSSATIRNIMKKLEDEGYLYQSHTSGGRIPTDKAYRFYVDYLTGAQKLAMHERMRIEKEYNSQMDEIDQLMAQTSRMLATISHSAGFVYSVNISDQRVTRVEFVPLSPSFVLAVLVVESGEVYHWPIRLSRAIQPERLRILSAFLNHQISGLPLGDARRKLWEYVSAEHSELTDVADLAVRLLDDIEKRRNAEDLRIEGFGQLVGNLAGDYEQSSFRDMLAVMEEKKRLSGLLGEKLKEFAKDDSLSGSSNVKVTIGRENELKELRDFSIVSSAYHVGERAMGLLGIVGPKHMEYPKMISLVNFMGELVETTLHQWDQFLLPGGAAAPADARRDAKKEKQNETKKRRKQP